MDERTKRLLDRGREHYQAGEFERAARALTPLARERLPFADVYHMLGVVHHHLGRLEDALAMFEEALRLNPGYTEAALNLAVTYNELGLYAQARGARKRMIAHRRAGADGHLDPYVKGKLANMHADIGKAYDQLGLHEDASHEYGMAVALCPTFVDIRARLGASLRNAGRLREAERELIAAKRENPQMVAPRLQLGMTYYAAGQNADAAREWREALALDPKNRFARLYLRLVSMGPPGPATTGGRNTKTPSGPGTRSKATGSLPDD
jgi:tetratricopeptide (TPR) repeat protein